MNRAPEEERSRSVRHADCQK